MVLGTKGGRPRDTLIQDAGAVKQALDNAITVAEQRNGRLIDAASLKQAMKYWGNHTKRMGILLTFTALRMGGGRYPPLSGAGGKRVLLAHIQIIRIIYYFPCQHLAHYPFVSDEISG